MEVLAKPFSDALKSNKQCDTWLPGAGQTSESGTYCVSLLSNVLVIIGCLRPVFAFGNKVVQREGRTHGV